MSDRRTTIAFKVDDTDHEVDLVEGDELERVRLARHRPERFQWNPVQRHIPGYWWSCTNSGHVPFESQLEKRRVCLADFDPTVERIVSQPFDLCADGKVWQQPDFMLLRTDHSITIVNVKRPEDAAQPKVREKFARVTRAVEAVGWEHEIWTGDNTDYARNVDFLSSCMRPQLELSLPVDPWDLDGLTLAQATHTVAAVVGDTARSYLLAALWRHDLTTDLSVSLQDQSVLRAAR